MSCNDKKYIMKTRLWQEAVTIIVTILKNIVISHHLQYLLNKCHNKSELTFLKNFKCGLKKLQWCSRGRKVAIIMKVG